MPRDVVAGLLFFGVTVVLVGKEAGWAKKARLMIIKLDKVTVRVELMRSWFWRPTQC